MVRRPTSPAVPLPSTLAAALEGNAALAGLAERIDRSNARMRVVHATVPEPLRSELSAGPIDDEGWTVLASNAAVAAKLRHLLPRLQAALIGQGWPDLPIRVRVQPR
jgi:hypothetical protein